MLTQKQDLCRHILRRLKVSAQAPDARSRGYQHFWTLQISILEIGERNFYFCFSKLNLTLWLLTNVDTRCARNRPPPARRWKPVSSAADHQVVEFLLRFKLLFSQLPKASGLANLLCLSHLSWQIQMQKSVSWVVQLLIREQVQRHRQQQQPQLQWMDGQMVTF